MHGVDVPPCATKPSTSLHDGDLTTLAAGLHRFGRLPPHSDQPQFANNCVSVTIARLLDYSDFHELWQDTFGHDLADTPLSIDETASLIAETGWVCKWTIYLPGNGRSAFRNMQRDPRFHLQPLRAVLYFGEQGVGHCVASGAANIGRVGHGDFICYQRDRYGVDLSHEVQAAKGIFVFHMRCEHYTPQWCSWVDRKTRRVSERRSDPIWIAKKREFMDSLLRTLRIGPGQRVEKGKRAGVSETAGKQQRASACEKPPTPTPWPHEGDLAPRPQKHSTSMERLLLAVASTLAVLFIVTKAIGYDMFRM